MNRQDKLLSELADKHGISLSQAKDILDCYTGMIAESFDNIKEYRNKDGIFDVDAFKTFHIDHFGKFVPNKKFVHKINGIVSRKKNLKNLYTQ